MRFFFCACILSVFSMLCSAAQWVNLSSSRATHFSSEVLKNSAEEIIVDFTVPGFKLNTKNIEGIEYAVIELDETVSSLEKAAPELPESGIFVAVPGCEYVRASIRLDESEIINTGIIIPSKGNLLRSVNPEMIPYEFGPQYRKRGWYPEDSKLIEVSVPFYMNGICGVQVTVRPFQAGELGKLKVHKKISVVLKPEGISRIHPVYAEDFAPLYSQFANIGNSRNAVTEWFNSIFGSMPSAPVQSRQLLIVAHDSLYNSAVPLKNWKIKAGWTVSLVKYSDTGGKPLELKRFLQEMFDRKNLTHVILVGDSEQIPPLKGRYEGADSDTCYVKLSGDDNVPDAYISRLSVETPQQARYVIGKTISYEKNPMYGDDSAWYTAALGIASAEGGFTKDYDRIELLNKNLEKYGFTKITRCYDTTPDGGADINHLINAVNSGCSIINYCGHGAETLWGTTLFSTWDVRKLRNGMKIPVIWSVACLTGSFVKNTCLAEGWLRAGSMEFPAGCIGMAAATTNMAWKPPCVWQKYIVVEETCKDMHPIAAVRNLYGVLKTMQKYGVQDSSYGNQLSEQLIYFGDGTVYLRDKIPKRAVPMIKKSRNSFSISGNYVEGCIVTAYCKDGSHPVSAVIGKNGAVLKIENGQILYSLTGNGIIPFVDEEI